MQLLQRRDRSWSTLIRARLEDRAASRLRALDGALPPVVAGDVRAITLTHATRRRSSSARRRFRSASVFLRTGAQQYGQRRVMTNLLIGPLAPRRLRNGPCARRFRPRRRRRRRRLVACGGADSQSANQLFPRLGDVVIVVRVPIDRPRRSRRNCERLAERSRGRAKRRGRTGPRAPCRKFEPAPARQSRATAPRSRRATVKRVLARKRFPCASCDERARGARGGRSAEDVGRMAEPASAPPRCQQRLARAVAPANTVTLLEPLERCQEPGVERVQLPERIDLDARRVASSSCEASVAQPAPLEEQSVELFEHARRGGFLQGRRHACLAASASASGDRVKSQPPGEPSRRAGCGRDPRACAHVRIPDRADASSSRQVGEPADMVDDFVFERRS